MFAPQRRHHRGLKPATTTLPEGLAAGAERTRGKASVEIWPGRSGPVACLVLQIGGCWPGPDAIAASSETG